MSFKDVLTGIGLGIGFFLGQTIATVALTYILAWMTAGGFETGQVL